MLYKLNDLAFDKYYRGTHGTKVNDFWYAVVQITDWLIYRNIRFHLTVLTVRISILEIRQTMRSIFRRLGGL